MCLRAGNQWACLSLCSLGGVGWPLGPSPGSPAFELLTLCLQVEAVLPSFVLIQQSSNCLSRCAKEAFLIQGVIDQVLSCTEVFWQLSITQ